MLIVLFTLTALLFARGQRRRRISLLRAVMFWSGLALLYLSLHTHLDYYAEHQFFVHRLQHLILHHLGPLVLMMSYPSSVLRAGLPLAWRIWLMRTQCTAPVRAFARVVGNPVLVTFLFIASILVWLIPSIQFISMLDWRIYRLMNWSVTITGLMYWRMLLDHRPAPPARMVVGMRVLSPVITMTPQILTGAIITFSQQDLYPIFELCGRAFGLPTLVDQSIGGLILWIPAALIEATGALIALRIWMRLSQHSRLQRAGSLASAFKLS